MSMQVPGTFNWRTDLPLPTNEQTFEAFQEGDVIFINPQQLSMTRSAKFTVTKVDKEKQTMEVKLGGKRLGQFDG